MHGERCYFLTFVSDRDPTLGSDRDLNLDLRHRWATVRTRCRTRYPQFEFATIYEWTPARGGHLHVIIKGVNDDALPWIDHISALVGLHMADHRPVNRPAGMASYLTKGLATPARATPWPKGFRPITFSRKWCPTWVSRADWARRHTRGR
jgi:hypothetical protein